MNGQDRAIKEGKSELTSDPELLPQCPFHLSKDSQAPEDWSDQNGKDTASLAG